MLCSQQYLFYFQLLKDGLLSRAKPLLIVLFDSMVGFVQAQARGLSGSTPSPTYSWQFADARSEGGFVGPSVRQALSGEQDRQNSF
jgi:hypothetical protein